MTDKKSKSKSNNKGKNKSKQWQQQILRYAQDDKTGGGYRDDTTTGG
jgi:hypothetical protein